MRRWLYTDAVGGPGSVALFILRVVVGAAFVFHGWMKIQQPFGWMGPNASMPGALQALAAVAEFGGGLALIVGLLTRLASVGIAAVMVGALAMVHIPAGHPFVAVGGPSSELATVYFACAILFLLLGPGRISLDACLFRKAPLEQPR
jgi:putative oxidoreductase